MTRDPQEELHRLVAYHKSNYGLIAHVERWALQIVEVPSTTGPLSVARLVFLEVAANRFRRQGGRVVLRYSFRGAMDSPIP